jgi:hypothetical protein
VRVLADPQARRAGGLGATGGRAAALGHEGLRPGGQRQERRRHRGSIAARAGHARSVLVVEGAGIVPTASGTVI